MTQGAIDLVQAELTMPGEPAVLLLQHKPCKGPELLATQPAPPKAQLPKAITKYTWWDSKDFISISIPVSADLAAGKQLTQQVQCSIQEHQLHCTFTQTAGQCSVQHRLALHNLTSAVRPAQSICLVDGQPVPLNATTPLPLDASPPHHPALPAPDSSSSCSLLQPCALALQQPPCGTETQLRSSTSSFSQPPVPVSLQPMEHQSKAAGTATASQVLLKLCKADPSKVWDRLSRAPPPMQSQPYKCAPPSPESMAVLRRALIQQRQERHRQQSHLQTGPFAAWPNTTCNIGASAEGPTDVVLQPLEPPSAAINSTCSSACSTSNAGPPAVIDTCKISDAVQVSCVLLGISAC